MAQTNKRKTVVRYDRIIAVAVIFIILIVLLVSCITSCGGDNSTGDSSSGKGNSVVSTDPASGTPGSTDPSGTDSTASVDPTGYKTTAMDAEAVYTGDLVVIMNTTSRIMRTTWYPSTRISCPPTRLRTGIRFWTSG